LFSSSTSPSVVTQNDEFGQDRATVALCDGGAFWSIRSFTMKKFALAAVCTLAMVGFVIAEEFTATITKVDGSKVTYMKGKKGEDKKEGSADVTADVKVLKGIPDMETKGKVNPGEAIDKGLKNPELLANISDKGVKAQITTNDAGKITQILVFGKKKGAE